MGSENDESKKEEEEKINACINWLLKGDQMVNVLPILSSKSMNTSRIRNHVRRRFNDNSITQRSVDRIMKSFVKADLATEARNYDFPGLGTLYVLTNFGEEVLKELEKQIEKTEDWNT